MLNWIAEKRKLIEIPTNGSVTEDDMPMTQIYTLLDNRLRDQRQIMLGALAGVIAMLSAFVAALGVKNAPGAVACFSVVVVLAILAVERWYQARLTIVEAEHVRLRFPNKTRIPPLDVNFPFGRLDVRVKDGVYPDTN